MDELVLRGMAKWPNVPAVYGWLALDRRGQWLLKGERIVNPTIVEFIGRNYEHDGEGRWFFQNGPQRVYLELGYTPYVVRAAAAPGGRIEFTTPNGKPVTTIGGAWLDEAGTLLIATEHGPAIVDDRDLEALLPSFIDVNGNPLDEEPLEKLMELAQQGREVPLWFKYGAGAPKVGTLQSSAAAGFFHYVPNPRQPAGEPECR
jgi:hypothetical protein